MRVHMTRRRMLIAPFAVVLVAALALCAVWFFVEPPFGGLPDNHVAATDSRVCRQTTVTTTRSRT
ncbi:hypothetical protein GXW82_29005 [Streptacidiphilus sp. 4-A2]|nr:hypothetical protein [Streptacidiphilus sp. 4-A2]